MNDNIKDIWNKHIDVQEQLLRARAVPIPIVSSSTRIVGEKLLMTVDERNQTDSMLMEIANTYSLSKEDINFYNGYFYVDTNISNQVDFATKQRLSEAAEHNFIKLSSRPIVDGIISVHNYLPLELCQLNAGGIKPEILNNRILFRNHYLPNSIVNSFEDKLGLKLFSYTYTFHINKQIIKKYDSTKSPYILPKVNDDGCSFSFVTKIMSKPKILLESYFEEQFEFDLKYTRLKKFFDSFFGRENVSFDYVFEYTFEQTKFARKRCMT